MRVNFLLKVIIFFVFLAVVGTPLFYINESVFPYIIPKTALFQSAAELIFFLWLVLAVSDKRYRPKKTPVVLALTAFLAVLILVSIIGIDPWRSFWSTYERGFGVVAILHLSAFFLVLSSLGREVPWKKLFYSSVITGFVVNIIAVAQLWKPNLLLREGAIGRPGATFGNPSLLAGYALFNLFLALYLLVLSRKPDNKNQKKSLLSGTALFIFTSIALNAAAIFLTQTRGALVALFGGLFVLILLFAARPPREEWLPGFVKKRKLYLSVVLFLIFIAAAFFFTRSSSVWSKVPVLGRFANLSLTSAEIQPRLSALATAWKGFKERPLFGWGWDNFNIVFNKYYDTRTLVFGYQETRFDKPHNFFMEYLVAGGILLALGFLVLLGAIIYELKRHKETVFPQICIAALAAFIVQNLFFFDSLGPALIFYLFVAYADHLYKSGMIGAEGNAAIDKRSEQPNGFISLPVLVVASVFSVVSVCGINVLTMTASYHEFLAYNYLTRGNHVAAAENFKETLDTWSPYRWNFGRDFASYLVTAYFYNPGAIPKEEVLMALSAMEKARDEHPLDAYNHYALVDMYNQISDIDPGKFLPLAEKEAAIALELSPNRQEVYFSLAKTKHMEGDDKVAIELAKHALDLDPRVPDAHFYYGMLLFSDNDLANGYDEVKRAISLGRQWKNFYEPRTVAGFFADAGHLSEALDLYKTALSTAPDDTETQIKLGIAYFFNNQPSEARDLLNAAARKFNFRESPALPQLKPILDQLGIVY